MDKESNEEVQLRDNSDWDQGCGSEKKRKCLGLRCILKIELMEIR